MKKLFARQLDPKSLNDMFLRFKEENDERQLVEAQLVMDNTSNWESRGESMDVNLF